MTWVWVMPGILGASVLAAGYALAAQAVFCLANLGLMFHNARRGDGAQTALFSAYALISGFGVFRCVVEAGR